MSSAEPAEPAPDRVPTEGPADWLVGPEEGLAAEMERRDAKHGAPQRPTLLKLAPPVDETPAGELSSTPDAPQATGEARMLPSSMPAALPPPPIARRVGQVMPDLESGSGFVHGPAMTWDPGMNSVPALKRESHAPPAPATVGEPSPGHDDFPMDDAEERARERAALLGNDSLVAAATVAARPHEVVSPEAFNLEAAPLPWYIQFAHTLRTDRRIQIMVGSVALVLAVIALWPRGPRPMSMGRLRRHPERYDGARVLVAGKVGQVFKVGGGYSFYLLDGHDSLVVFTRSRTPHERQHLKISGTMSNGSLDGQPTLSLFEETDSSK